MKLIKIVTITFLCFCNLAICQKAEKLDSLFLSLYQQKSFNGNVLIAENGKIIYKNSFGLSNELTKEKLKDNSIFELASVSKQFTAIGIVILKEKGKLNFDDDIIKFIPEFKNYKNITIRNLLNHTSGLPDYMKLIDSLIVEKNWKQKSKIATNKTIIDLFSKHNPKILFQPNEKWEYSNTGYALLASIIEKISDKSYAEFLKTEIFLPLKMKNTFIHRRRYEPKKIKNYAFGYVSDSLKRNVLPDEVKTDNLNKYVYSMDGIVGDGTVNSTIIDLLKWDRVLYSNKIISEKSKNEIFSEGILNDKTKTDYGFGWELKSNGVFGRISSHGGGWPGYKTYIERHIENDKTIIMLQNNDNENIFYPIKQIREILYAIKPTKIISLENSEKEIFAGSYKTDKNDFRNIDVENGKLFIVIDPNDKMELKPISKTKFIVEGFSPDVYYEFIIENGKVEKYIMTQPELKNTKEALKVK